MHDESQVLIIIGNITSECGFPADTISENANVYPVCRITHAPPKEFGLRIDLCPYFLQEEDGAPASFWVNFSAWWQQWTFKFEGVQELESFMQQWKKSFPNAFFVVHGYIHNYDHQGKKVFALDKQYSEAIDELVTRFSKP